MKGDNAAGGSSAALPFVESRRWLLEQISRNEVRWSRDVPPYEWEAVRTTILNSHEGGGTVQAATRWHHFEIYVAPDYMKQGIGQR